MEDLILVLDLDLVNLGPAWEMDHLAWALWVVHSEGVSVGLDLLVESLVLLLGMGLLDLGDQGVILLVEFLVLVLDFDLVDLGPAVDLD